MLALTLKGESDSFPMKVGGQEERETKSPGKSAP